MDDLDFFSNDQEMFSYDISSGDVSDDTDSFDLNSFSSSKITDSVNGNKKSSKRRRKRKKGRILKTILTLFLIGLIAVSVVVSVFLVYVFTMVDGTMDEDLNDLKLNFTTTIYVDDGGGEFSEYQRLHGEFNRIWIPYDPVAIKNGDEEYSGIPQSLVDAFVAIEDKRFFQHTGVDWKRTFAAFANMFVDLYSSNQGGSTITQQLVKNLTDDRTQKASRKVREIMRARYLETNYSKDTIIECYLNTIPLGHGIYGVEVAANYYFGKTANELTLLECASIAAITKSPSYYAPDDNPENNLKRRGTVLYEMMDQGYIEKDEYEKAKSEELKVVASKEALLEADTNSYFVDGLIDQVIKDLAKKYDYDEKHASKMFYSGGYKIYATIDKDIQKTLDEVFSDKKYSVKGSDGQYLQAGMTVMDYQGNIKGVAGGLGEKTGNRGFNRATSAVRQPGSTMKPISAYAPAIENDIIHYSSIVNDKRTTYHGWAPVNWYRSYWGNITVQYALERSSNTIPVYLVDKLGVQTSYDFLTQKLGISTLTDKDLDYSPLGMGGTNGGLTTMESAAAFAVFGNGGLYYEPTFYSKVTDQRGELILSADTQPKMAISEDTATVMNHLLQQVVYGANGTGAGAKSYIKNMKIYAKTGTSNDQNDLWFVSGSPYYVASTWCGYDTMQKIAQSNSAHKLWGAVMSKIHSGLEVKEFTDSDYAVKRYYCKSSGMLATGSCSSKAVGWYRKSNTPGKCTTHGGTVLGDPDEVESSENSSSSGGASGSSSGSSSSNSGSSSGTTTE